MRILSNDELLEFVSLTLMTNHNLQKKAIREIENLTIEKSNPI